MDSIAKQLSSFIIDNMLLGKKIDVGATRSFLEAGIIDSTGVLELVQYLEDTWGITVKDDEMVPENLDSLENLVRFVQRKTSPTVAPTQTAPMMSA
jgi:acyl carrier protein